MTAPLCIDLFCGLGGWAEGFLAEGWRVIGFDIERHVYPGQLVVQDVSTLHGSQFRHADLIVASPPCQAYSYRAMPWRRAKALPPPDNTLFETPFRIQREASTAAGRYVPLIVENVRGAQPWVGRAQWHHGSYYLWGDVPALMPVLHGFPAASAAASSGAASTGCTPSSVPALQSKNGTTILTALAGREAIKGHGGDWFGKAEKRGDPREASAYSLRSEAVKTPGQVHWSKAKAAGKPHIPHLTNPWEHDAVKQAGLSGDRWFDDGAAHFSSRSVRRKAATALIAKIPLSLATHIARVFKP